jgi:hypothetical protein
MKPRLPKVGETAARSAKAAADALLRLARLSCKVSIARKGLIFFGIATMARAKPVNLGTISFPTQQAASLFFKAMLSRYSPEDTVSNTDGVALAELLKRHPDYDRKVGNGIHHFEVMRADFNSKCFAIVHRDGSRVDFSYKICITSVADPP